MTLTNKFCQHRTYGQKLQKPGFYTRTKRCKNVLVYTTRFLGDLRSQYSKTLLKSRRIVGAINTAPAWLAATITNLNAPYIAIEKPSFTARESFRGMPKELAVPPARQTPKPHLCKLAIGQCGYFWTQR